MRSALTSIGMAFAIVGALTAIIAWRAEAWDRCRAAGHTWAFCVLEPG